MGGDGSGGHNRKSIEQHIEAGTYRKDRHGDSPLAIKPEHVKYRTLHALVCCGCGVNYQHMSRNHQFCTIQCANRYHNNQRAIPDVFICKQCGKEYRAKSYERNKYCSRECYFQACKEGKIVNVLRERLSIDAKAREAKEREANRIRRHKSCDICNKQFDDKSSKGARKRCSRECDREDKRRRALVSDRTNHISRQFKCKECGKEHSSEYGDKRQSFCSRKCMKKYGSRIGHHIRRVRAKALPYERVNPLNVFMRDRWHCKMCHISTPKRYRGTIKDNAPELDHIIPIALGGSHTWVNLQCLCRACNQKKGATMAQTQLCLV